MKRKKITTMEATQKGKKLIYAEVINIILLCLSDYIMYYSNGITKSIISNLQILLCISLFIIGAKLMYISTYFYKSKKSTSSRKNEIQKII